MAGFYRLMRRTLRSPAQGADTVAWLASPSASYASGGYYWDRARKSLDLPLAATRASEADVDALVAWLEAGRGEVARPGSKM